MTTGVSVVLLALAYVGGLFALAWYGDRRPSAERRPRPLLYALSLAVFCTSWTFFGSVGLAAHTGYDFFPVYVGGIIAFGLGWRLIQHIIRVAKAQNLTSIADFVSARYGKSPGVGVVVTVISVVGTLPYIALQLKAVVLSLDVLGGPSGRQQLDTAFAVAVLLATFTVLFGTRHSDTTEHQDGMMLAIAAESLIKLMAFLAVGVFVTLMVFSSPAAFFDDVRRHPELTRLFSAGINWPTWLTVSLLSFCAILLLPRQFHVAVVENRHPSEIRTARWLFPTYLVAINLFVAPIAAAGLLILPPETPADTFVLALPLALQSYTFALFAFIGGLSAATAMVIVDTIALAIMVSNGLAMPWLLRWRGRAVRQSARRDDLPADMERMLLLIRRVAIFAIVMLGYVTYLLLDKVSGLAGIGLVSFAAVAQLAPAFFAGLFWPYGTSRGAIAGMLVGFAVWAYTLVTPWFVQAGLLSTAVLTDGPLGLAFLNPQALFFSSLDPLTHGVIWSLTANILTFVFVSLQRQPSPLERQQATAFSLLAAPTADAFPPGTSRWAGSTTGLTVEGLQAVLARYLGAERTERGFREYEAKSQRRLSPAAAVDPELTSYAERLLTSAVGAASARLIMALQLTRDSVDDEHALRLLDDATEALQFNRKVLHSALDQVRHGLAVFDQEMRLVSWNRQFRELLDLPPAYGQFAIPLRILLERVASNKNIAPAQIETWVADRIARLTRASEPYYEHMDGGRRILEVRTAPVPQGGFVATFADITERKLAADALTAANARLERGIAEATSELQAAKEAADRANEDKTRFLAAASHDVLQPLNAARLYASSLVERLAEKPEGGIARNIDASLEAVEEILGALIDIARLDTGRLAPLPMAFPLNELFDQLKVEFAPLARERKLDLRVVPTSVWVDTDRRLLRRVLQNLVSNALKYTRSGGVVVGARRVATAGRRPGEVIFQVTDTGAGIPPAKQELIFREFQRLEETAVGVAGLGLGLSIVERISRTMKHPVDVQSEVGKGSTFRVRIPRTAPMAEALRPVPAGTGYATVGGQFTGLSVMVIDNEPSVLAGMEALLQGWGCNVFQAQSTKEALQVLFAGDVRPDLVLADYHLDLGTGLDAVSAIRVRLGEGVPAAIVTADSSPEVQIEARRFNCATLRKPVRAAALRALITQLTLKRAAAE